MMAYFDSVTGLVPCRVVAIGNRKDSGSEARIQFTASRGPYRRGEFYTTVLRNVVPRSAVHRSRQHCGQYRIYPYSWAND